MNTTRTVALSDIRNNADVVLLLIMNTADEEEYGETQNLTTDDADVDFEYDDIDSSTSYNAFIRSFLANHDLAPYGILDADIDLEQVGKGRFEMVINADLFHFSRVIVSPSITTSEAIYLRKQIHLHTTVTMALNDDNDGFDLTFALDSINTNYGVIGQFDLLERGVVPNILIELTKAHMGDKFIAYASDENLLDTDDEFEDDDIEDDTDDDENDDTDDEEDEEE